MLGLSSRIADLSKPFASEGNAEHMILIPPAYAYHGSGLMEWKLVALHLLPERLRDGDQVGGLPVLAPLAPRLGAVPGRCGFDLLGRHQLASVPPPRPGSPTQ